MQVVLELYQFIHKVDQLQGGVVQNCDALCDLLYPNNCNYTCVVIVFVYEIEQGFIKRA